MHRQSSKNPASQQSFSPLQSFSTQQSVCRPIEGFRPPSSPHNESINLSILSLRLCFSVSPRAGHRWAAASGGGRWESDESILTATDDVTPVSNRGTPAAAYEPTNHNPSRPARTHVRTTHPHPHVRTTRTYTIPTYHTHAHIPYARTTHTHAPRTHTHIYIHIVYENAKNIKIIEYIRVFVSTTGRRSHASKTQTRRTKEGGRGGRAETLQRRQPLVGLQRLQSYYRPLERQVRLYMWVHGRA